VGETRAGHIVLGRFADKLLEAAEKAERERATLLASSPTLHRCPGWLWMNSIAEAIRRSPSPGNPVPPEDLS